MRTAEERARLAGNRPRLGMHAPGLLGRVMTFAFGAMLLLGALMLSVLVFASIATVGAVMFGYLWWKTRGLRKQMRERQMHENAPKGSPGGCVIEGEVIRDDGPHDPDRG